MAKSGEQASVRGPGGPGRQPATRRRVERASIPALTALTRVPKWLMVVGLALCLFFGLIQTSALAWLGGVLLLIVAAFLGWLLALSWPALTPGSRGMRLVVVVALVGIACLRFFHRF